MRLGHGGGVGGENRGRTAGADGGWSRGVFVAAGLAGACEGRHATRDGEYYQA